MSREYKHPAVLEKLAIEMMRDMLSNVYDNKSEKLRRYEWRISVSAKCDHNEALFADWMLDYIPQNGDKARSDFEEK